MAVTIADKVDAVLRIGDECLTLCALCIEAGDGLVECVMSAIESCQVGVEQVVRIARNNVARLSQRLMDQVKELVDKCYVSLLAVWEELRSGGCMEGVVAEEKLAEMMRRVRVDDDRVGQLNVAMLTSRRGPGELLIDQLEFQQSDAMKSGVHQRTKKEQSPNRAEVLAFTPPYAPPVLYTDKMSIQLDVPLQPPENAWADLNLLRGWIRQCDEKHQDHCCLSATSQAIFSRRPKWLIDVNRKCIVHGRHVREYIALSYVWGDAQRLFRVTRALQMKMMINGFLGKTETRQALPRTVLNAIQLTKLLGQRYIWVDCICIAEDDPWEMEQELEAMASIYVNSHLTIVASTGSSDAGLVGLEGLTAPFVREIDSVTSFHEALKCHHERVKKSIWHNRGWTFQEQILSRKLMIFSPAGVTWECHCAVWLEGMEPVEGQCGALEHVVYEGPAAISQSNLSEFARHVEVYNERELSYPDDIARAFAGIMTNLSSGFADGFACGLPVAHLNTALLWRNSVAMSKRWLTFDEFPERPTLPSWSWMLWRGKLILELWTDECHNRLEPLVQWSYKIKMGGPWIPIARSTPDGTGALGPQTRYRIKDDVAEDSLDDDFLTDLKCNLDDNLSWQMKRCPLYLHARPRRAFFIKQENAYLEGLTYSLPADYLNYSIATISGQFAGRLTSLRDRWLQPKTMCEVVAISETDIAMDFTIGTSPVAIGRESTEAVKEYPANNIWTNVLWIEWNKGVAYRKGVGQILKTVWLAEEEKGRLDEIDLVLG